MKDMDPSPSIDKSQGLASALMPKSFSIHALDTSPWNPWSLLLFLSSLNLVALASTFSLLGGSLLFFTFLSLRLPLLSCRHHMPPPITAVSYSVSSELDSFPALAWALFHKLSVSLAFSPHANIYLGFLPKLIFSFCKTLTGSKVSLESKSWHSKHPGISPQLSSYSRDVCLSLLVSRRLEWKKKDTICLLILVLGDGYFHGNSLCVYR